MSQPNVSQDLVKMHEIRSVKSGSVPLNHFVTSLYSHKTITRCMDWQSFIVISRSIDQKLSRIRVSCHEHTQFCKLCSEHLASYSVQFPSSPENRCTQFLIVENKTELVEAASSSPYEIESLT